MRLHHSSKYRAKPIQKELLPLLEAITEDFLKEVVEVIAIPRNFYQEAENNRIVLYWLKQQFESYGYQTEIQGECKNLIAYSAVKMNSTPQILFGAHFDSVPFTPGADDNASGVASILACAKVIAESKLEVPIVFLAFNREEDGLLGSRDFVKNYLLASKFKISLAHILEMVGYCKHNKGSQQTPTGLPIHAPKAGNFLGIVANRDSKKVVDKILSVAKSYFPEFPVLGLKVFFGLEKHFPVLGRSDHEPFWKARIPALMWTDTSEYRNPNYHKTTDTPESLDYSFLRRVTQLLLLQALTYTAA